MIRLLSIDRDVEVLEADEARSCCSGSTATVTFGVRLEGAGCQLFKSQLSSPSGVPKINLVNSSEGEHLEYFSVKVIVLLGRVLR